MSNSNFQLSNVFDVKGKVALVTGGGSGIGLMVIRINMVLRVYIVLMFPGHPSSCYQRIQGLHRWPHRREAQNGPADLRQGHLRRNHPYRWRRYQEERD